jgi:hypothetical protein
MTRREIHSPRKSIKPVVLAIAMALLALTSALAAQAQKQDAAAEWKPVEAALGRGGQLLPGGVFKVGMPRSDLHVKVGSVEIKPALALGSWAAFKKTGDGTLMMGDLVLTESEVEAVMSKLQAGGIEQTALHNHLLGETPRVMYMHIHGYGDAVKLAHALHDALALTATPLPADSKPAQGPALDVAKIEKILGHKGTMHGSVLQFGVPRREKITDHGVEIPPSMGVATGINFQPTGEGQAAVTGDFVLLGSEVNPVIRTLRDKGIEVTALHGHMLTEQPRLFFMHFWADGDAVRLAQALKTALDTTNSAK